MMMESFLNMRRKEEKLYKNLWLRVKKAAKKKAVKKKKAKKK